MPRQSNAQIIENLKKASEGIKARAGRADASKAKLREAQKLLAEKKAREAGQKLPTEKRHKEDYKRLKGNIQKSRSDLHVNKKTGKREITTHMTIHKGLTAKEKTGLKKSILKAVKKYLN